MNGNDQALAMLETIRAHGAVRMGMIQHIDEAAKRQHTPKVAFVAEPADYNSSSGKHIAAGEIEHPVRAVTMGKLTTAMLGPAALAHPNAATLPVPLVNPA